MLKKRHLVTVGVVGVEARLFICIHFHTVCKFYKSDQSENTITIVHGHSVSGESSHSENA